MRNHAMRTRFVLLHISLVTISGLVAVVSAQCLDSISPHEIISAEGGVYTLDGAYNRQIKAKMFYVGNCGATSSFANAPGTKFNGDFTMLSQGPAYGNGDCLVKNEGAQSVYDSFQALVIKTNGWALEPQRIDLEDVDGEASAQSSDTRMESMAIFGMRDGVLVEPTVQFYEQSILERKSYKITAAAMAEMNLDLGDSIVTGGEYGGDSNSVYNCPWHSNPDAAKCRMTAGFTEAVDTLVIMFAMKKKSQSNPSGAVAISELVFQCGCRCALTDAGPREITVPVPNDSGQCTKIQSTSIKTECDVLGSSWCSEDDADGYFMTGAQLGNGNYPCSKNPTSRARFLGAYEPETVFGW